MPAPEPSDRAPDAVVLLTDFGLADGYVGQMKGVLLGVAPGAPIVDLSHAVPPQDVRTGGFVLRTAYRTFPDGTVFCCVVDPGVGSDRRPVAVRVRADGRRYRLVGPDNGLFSAVLSEATVEAAVVLDDPGYHRDRVSRTFHGRDLFAPVAGHLARGVALETLGSALAVDRLVRLPGVPAVPVGRTWRVRIQHVDRFGNLVTNLRSERLDRGPPGWRVRLDADDPIPVATTFADVGLGDPVAYPGSSGFLEIGVRNGSAADELGLVLDGTVVVEPVDDANDDEG